MWTSNTVRNKSAEKMHKTIHDHTQWFFVPDFLYLYKSMIWKKILMMQSVLLQKSCSKSFTLSFKFASICWLFTPLDIPASISTWALKSHYRYADLISFNPTSFLHKHMVLCSWGHIPVESTVSNMSTTASTCTPSLPMESIHQHSMPAWVSHFTLDRQCWLNTGMYEFPPVTQLYSVRTMMLSQLGANNIQAILFGFFNQFVLLPFE